MYWRVPLLICARRKRARQPSIDARTGHGEIGKKQSKARYVAHVCMGLDSDSQMRATGAGGCAMLVVLHLG